VVWGVDSYGALSTVRINVPDYRLDNPAFFGPGGFFS
jgi:hypothetical protein